MTRLRYIGGALLPGALAGGIWLLGQPAWAFSPWLLLVVTAGGVGYLLLAAGPTDLAAALGRERPPSERSGAAERLVALAASYRTSGTRAAEDALRTAGGPVERRGLQLLATGATAAEMAASLDRLVTAGRQADTGPERIWRQLAAGLINVGAVLALLGMAMALSRPATEQTALALAAALLPTAYGVAVGGFVVGPLQAAARREAAARQANRELWREGLVAIAGGCHPRLLAEQLEVAKDSRLRPVA